MSESDFLQAQRLITEDKDGDALAYLERSLTNNPDNSAALARLTTLLTYRAWFLPSLTIKLNDVGWSTQLSKDGKLIRTVSGQANTVRVWNAQTGRPSTQPMKPDDFVRYSQYSPDGKRLVTTSNNITRVWNVQTGQPLTGPLQIEDGVWSAWFSPDGKRIFTASATTARVWDAQTGQPLTEEPLEFNIPTGRGVVLSIGPTPSTQFSPDGKRIVTTSVNVVRVWGLETDALPELLKQDSTVSSAQFSPDGTRIVTASLDGTARVWNAQTGQQLAKLKHGGPVYSAQFSPDGTRVVTASQDQTARVWDARTGQPLTEPLKHGGEVLAAQFSPDGKRIVTVSGDGVAYVWDAQTGQQISELKHGSPWVTPSPKFLRSTGQTLSELEHETEILSAQFSPDGKRIVSTSQEGTAPVWSAQTGQILTKSWILGMGVRSAQFSPDGKRIIVTDSPDWTVFVCDAQTGEPKTQIFTGDSITSAQCSPDGKWIVTTLQDGTTRVWDAQTGQPLTELIELGGPVKSAQFSPDGKFIVTASADGTARVWDAQTGQPLTEPMKHDGSVNSAQFSPDGKRIVTVSGNTARVWDIAPVSDQFPNWLLPLTEAISGQFLDEQSVLEPTKLDRVATINQIRRELNQSSDNDGWTEWGRWFLADPATRTISPFSKMTVPQYIEDLIQENTTNSLDEAESLAFGNTNLLHQIFTARQTLEPKTNSLPRP
ncbi:MAG TPA: WD40 repeat domain-containing protein [Candidatus Aquilonibacter sp.]|nr:WD40 repeat domain-containing protein [Candidatus Aquilonibacter sp.]